MFLAPTAHIQIKTIIIPFPWWNGIGKQTTLLARVIWLFAELNPSIFNARKKKFRIDENGLVLSCISALVERLDIDGCTMVSLTYVVIKIAIRRSIKSVPGGWYRKKCASTSKTDQSTLVQRFSDSLSFRVSRYVMLFILTFNIMKRYTTARDRAFAFAWVGFAWHSDSLVVFGCVS